MRDALFDLCRRFADAHVDSSGVAVTPVPGITLVRALHPGDLQAAIARPLVAMLLQGRKSVTTGLASFDYGPGEAMVIAADVPTTSQITEASQRFPYYALVLELDLAILRELQELGVGFGTYGPSIKPQELKNQMLLRIPKLQWLTVQQSGMRAVVVVRERPEKEPVLDRRSPVNVVAARAGVLTRVQAEAGNCLCAPGQAVTAGELLVSAYTDFGFKTQVTAARAEIYAETIRRATCVLPQHRSVKEAKTARRSAVSLLVGRRRITLFGGGIPEKPCEKETKTYWLTLPGGFSLPLGIAITGIYEYDTRDEILQEASVQQSLLGQIQTRAQRDMIAGTILDSRCRIQTADGCIRLCATLRCEEMIARMQPANLKEAIE